MAKTAREKREDAIEAREKTRDILKSGKNPKTGKKLSKSTEKKLEQRMLDQGARARVQGEKLRDESGRERGQATRYIGPTGAATTWDDPRAVQARASRDLPTPTIYQDVNRARMALQKGDTTAQKRAAFKELWGDPGSKKYKEMQDWQAGEIAAGRYNKNLSLLDNLEDLLDLDDSKTRAAKMTGGSEYLATDYDRPGLLDWSHLAPPEMPGTLGTAQAQQSLLDRDLALYQPWRRPGVGEAFEYQPPAAPTYATRASLLGGAGPSVSGTGDDTTTTDNGNGKTYGPGGTYDNYQDWYMAPENPAGHYWALANTARAKGETSPWGNQMVNGIWQYTGGSAPTGPTGPSSTAARQDITQNQFQDLFADVGQVGGGNNLLGANDYRATTGIRPENILAAPLAATAPASARFGQLNTQPQYWRGGAGSSLPIQYVHQMDDSAGRGAGILSGSVPFGQVGAEGYIGDYATPQSILAGLNYNIQGTST